MKNRFPFGFLLLLLLLGRGLRAQISIVPSDEVLYAPFSDGDVEQFRTPDKIFYPETWFHYIGGNVSKEGITKDLEAIASAGFSGVQLFHGQFGGSWPGVDPQITCLSPLWDGMVQHTGEECRRLGLRFTMQNCPGWAMAGGPWIEPENAMRHLAWSRTDCVSKGEAVVLQLSLPQQGQEEWRDYRDVRVLAFPTPEGDTGQPLHPTVLQSNYAADWQKQLSGEASNALSLPATDNDRPHWVEFEFPKTTPIRTLEFPSIQAANHGWCYDPGISLRLEASLPDGTWKEVLNTEMPQSNWQDDYPISLACSEAETVRKYRLSIVNVHAISLGNIRLFTAARKNNWESEAAWVLRSLDRKGDEVQQSSDAYVSLKKIVDISDKMDSDGRLTWKAPKGKWTLLRIGHVNTGQRNAPAPPEGTGWEVNKFSRQASQIHFDGYIGRLVKENAPLSGGLLNGVLLDSWECRTQTWTEGMEDAFRALTGYDLTAYLPALLGYVIDNPESTSRFLCDWRRSINRLYVDNFYGNMSRLAAENNLSITYETAAGDVFPADILEYYKFADVPMCEFWQPLMENYVGSLNFKPIKPATSAARIYGKPRVAAEAFTSFSHTWDEHWQMLKEVANVNSIEGVTHLVFHTYTHNPNVSSLAPGTSFSGAGIGTPFLRGQTWWNYMPEFTSYLARCSFLLERGKPVSDVLWYLGDENNHKPDQLSPFPTGFKYDYCNQDALLNRIKVEDGQLVTPEGLCYRVLWLPDAKRLCPETLEKLYALIQEGATVVGDAPQSMATLSDDARQQKRFDRLVKQIWKQGKYAGKKSMIGKGQVISGLPLDEALALLDLSPDVKSADALWTHRAVDKADWYFVTAPQGKQVHEKMDFRNRGEVELWDPLTGRTTPLPYETRGERTLVEINLAEAASCFVVFRKEKSAIAPALEKKEKIFSTPLPLAGGWNLSFPQGWGIDSSLRLDRLMPWKELDLSPEGKAFSGTAVYNITFELAETAGKEWILDLGEVDMIAEVLLNGRKVQTLWSTPYSTDITDYVVEGKNRLEVKVTSTWFNRLVYDAGLPEVQRKTWVLRWPDRKESLRRSGLMGPVVVKSASVR